MRPSSVFRLSSSSRSNSATVAGRFHNLVTHGSRTSESSVLDVGIWRERSIRVGPHDEPLLLAIHGQAVVEKFGTKVRRDRLNGPNFRCVGGQMLVITAGQGGLTLVR